MRHWHSFNTWLFLLFGSLILIQSCLPDPAQNPAEEPTGTNQTNPVPDFRFATWNLRMILRPADVAGRASAFLAAGRDLRPDILAVQEVTSRAEVEAVRDAMGLQGYAVACSDFFEDSDDPGAFEVGIISRFPIAETMEYDITPEGQPGERRLIAVAPFASRDIAEGRGFLWVHIPEARLTVAVVHLKSSRGESGQSDGMNAEKREFVVSAVAKVIAADSSKFQDYGHLVAGDFNVGHGDSSKNGIDPHQDSFNPGPNSDGYDETHAILWAGLIDNLRMDNLAGSIATTTFPGFPGTPIDNIYVVGRRAAFFQVAQKATQTHGSDHFAVWTQYQAPTAGQSGQ